MVSASADILSASRAFFAVQKPVATTSAGGDSDPPGVMTTKWYSGTAASPGRGLRNPWALLPCGKGMPLSRIGRTGVREWVRKLRWRAVQ